MDSTVLAALVVLMFSVVCRQRSKKAGKVFSCLCCTSAPVQLSLHHFRWWRIGLRLVHIAFDRTSFHVYIWLRRNFVLHYSFLRVSSLLLRTFAPVILSNSPMQSTDVKNISDLRGSNKKNPWRQIGRARWPNISLFSSYLTVCRRIVQMVSYSVWEVRRSTTLLEI